MMPMLLPVDCSDSTFLTQLYAAAPGRYCRCRTVHAQVFSPLAHRRLVPETELRVARGAKGDVQRRGERMVLPLTDAISTIWPTGRSIRENQPRTDRPAEIALRTTAR